MAILGDMLRENSLEEHYVTAHPGDDLSTLVPSLPPHTELVLLPGMYVLTAPIEIYNPYLTIHNTRAQIMWQESSGTVLTMDENSSYFTMRGLHFYCTSGNNTSRAIDVTDKLREFVIEDCRFYSFHSPVSLVNTTGVYVNRCKIQDYVGDGLYVGAGCTDVDISYSSFSRSATSSVVAGYAIKVANSGITGGVSIAHNRITGSAGTGVNGIQTNCYHAHVIGNTSANCIATGNVFDNPINDAGKNNTIL